MISRLWRTVDGLRGLVESIADLDYVVFDTPSDYLKNHEPRGEITIEQDTADGSFDGLSSWAEKWSNQRLWTGVDRSRLMEMQGAALAKGAGAAAAKKAQKLFDAAFEDRVRILSTTHFGMSAPVMNLARLGIAREMVDDAVKKSAAGLGLLKKTARKGLKQNELKLIDYRRGIPSGVIKFTAHPSRGLVRIPLKDSKGETPLTLYRGKKPVPSAIINERGGSLLIVVDEFRAGKESLYRLETKAPAKAPKIDHPVRFHTMGTGIGNGLLEVSFNQRGACVEIRGKENQLLGTSLLESAVTYKGRRVPVAEWTLTGKEIFGDGVAGILTFEGEAHLPKGGRKSIRFRREILLAAGLPWFYVTMDVEYPETDHKGFSKGKAERLQQTWDSRWVEVMPCEIDPCITGTDETPLRIWKHNYCGHVSTFDLHYGRFSKNKTLDSVNNQVTNGWVAASNGSRGLLLAQSAEELTSMAFCPVRTLECDRGLAMRMNPFGSYSGRQYKYASAFTGIGRFLAIQASASDHIKPYAPSYNGRRQRFTLMVAPYGGDAPPEELQNNAMAFAWPALAVAKSDLVRAMPAETWTFEGDES